MMNSFIFLKNFPYDLFIQALLHSRKKCLTNFGVFKNKITVLDAVNFEISKNRQNCIHKHAYIFLRTNRFKNECNSC